MKTALDLAFACPNEACGLPVEGRLTPAVNAMTCTACETETTLHDVPALLDSAPIKPCPVCGSEDFYWQRDFNRALGIFIVVVGCALGPFTSWISVVIAVAIDAILYLIVPSVVVCYACNAQLRRFTEAQRPEVFDIAIHDVYKFNRRHPPRREMAVAGPLQKRLRKEAGRS